jgi:septum site-determining protein MinD
MTRFIAVISGKGGVGKTSVTLNLGHSLSLQGKKIVVVDANLATANLGHHLGKVIHSATLNDFLRKKKHIHEVVHKHEQGFSYIPASSSYLEFKNTDANRIGKVMEHLDNGIDLVLFDSPSGMGQELVELLHHTDEVIVVTTATNSSVMEALKSMEIAKAKGNLVSGVVLNMTHNGKHELSEKEVKKLLGVPIIANIEHNRKMHRAQYQGKTLLESGFFARLSQPAKEFKKLSDFLLMNFER